MKKILRLITSSLMIVLLSTGCSSKKAEKPKVDDKPPMVLYEQAKQALESASFEKASDILEALDTRYPFGPHSDQVQLDLIYAYYKRGETAFTLANIDRFLRLNPTHPDLDYIYYMRGLTYISADQQFFQDLFGIDRYNRDPNNAIQAFKDLSRIIKYYPSSEYAVDAQQRIIDLKDRLARYEIGIAQWYLKREAYIAAINRCKIVLNNYPDMPAVEQALEIMIASYNVLGIEEPKMNALAVLKLNYPKNLTLIDVKP
ncbi:putative lipoprotein [Psychromonas ingrahamii 37]|uniref:Outer membrane protein assembly factor BamD n=1 Tax=Psychromonas ingrahamii (strain DSM 17664 / CCUG 51855 / 37) TaxID=357804 RepID=A1SZN8_PSYIN|nr:outer membrane protein assembly factor BamD [Psychromonas ingrahamii]ABM04953.1 putative lipoprotein [Psychromonas ingrahamii 37]